MAVLHRALFTWFLLLIFLILVSLRLDEKTSWNWFIVFIPMWIFDCVLLSYVLLKLITQCKQQHQQTQLQRMSSGSTGGPMSSAAATAVGGGGTGSSSSNQAEGGTFASTILSRRSGGGGGRFTDRSSSVVVTAVNRRLLYLFGILVKIVFQAILCIKMEKMNDLGLYYVFVPLWVVLVATSVDVFTHLVSLYRS